MFFLTWCYIMLDLVWFSTIFPPITFALCLLTTILPLWSACGIFWSVGWSWSVNWTAEGHKGKLSWPTLMGFYLTQKCHCHATAYAAKMHLLLCLSHALSSTCSYLRCTFKFCCIFSVLNDLHLSSKSPNVKCTL